MEHSLGFSIFKPFTQDMFFVQSIQDQFDQHKVFDQRAKRKQKIVSDSLSMGAMKKAMHHTDIVVSVLSMYFSKPLGTFVINCAVTGIACGSRYSRWKQHPFT